MKLECSFRSLAAVAVLAMSIALLTGCSGNQRGGAQLRGDSQTNAEKAGELNKQLGTEYLRKGNLALAKEKLERAERYNPRDAEVHSVLAVLYERLGIPKEVDEHYRTAIRLAPKDPQISNNYAVYLCRNGRPDEGVKRFLESAQNPLYRTPELAYTNAGVCLRAAKRFDEAARSYARALQIRPNNAEAVYQSADLEMERGDLMKSRDLIDKYLGTYDATPDLLLTAVRLTRAQGDRVAEDKFTRRLRVEFPNSQQFRSLNESDATKRNPG
ncbi:MAG: type IV pilus biogenesis/stability protein PilW [Gammaproteobacteria bacterium]